MIPSRFAPNSMPTRAFTAANFDDSLTDSQDTFNRAPFQDQEDDSFHNSGDGDYFASSKRDQRSGSSKHSGDDDATDFSWGFVRKKMDFFSESTDTDKENQKKKKKKKKKHHRHHHSSVQQDDFPSPKKPQKVPFKKKKHSKKKKSMSRGSSSSGSRRYREKLSKRSLKEPRRRTRKRKSSSSSSWWSPHKAPNTIADVDFNHFIVPIKDPLHKPQNPVQRSKRREKTKRQQRNGDDGTTTTVQETTQRRRKSQNHSEFPEDKEWPAPETRMGHRSVWSRSLRTLETSDNNRCFTPEPFRGKRKASMASPNKQQAHVLQKEQLQRHQQIKQNPYFAPQYVGDDQHAIFSNSIDSSNNSSGGIRWDTYTLNMSGESGGSSLPPSSYKDGSPSWFPFFAAKNGGSEHDSPEQYEYHSKQQSSREQSPEEQQQDDTPTVAASPKAVEQDEQQESSKEEQNNSSSSSDFRQDLQTSSSFRGSKIADVSSTLQHERSKLFDSDPRQQRRKSSLSTGQQEEKTEEKTEEEATDSLYMATPFVVATTTASSSGRSVSSSSSSSVPSSASSSAPSSAPSSEPSSSFSSSEHSKESSRSDSTGGGGGGEEDVEEGESSESSEPNDFNDEQEEDDDYYTHEMTVVRKQSLHRQKRHESGSGGTYSSQSFSSSRPSVGSRHTDLSVATTKADNLGSSIRQEETPFNYSMVQAPAAQQYVREQDHVIQPNRYNDHFFDEEDGIIYDSLYPPPVNYDHAPGGGMGPPNDVVDDSTSLDEYPSTPDPLKRWILYGAIAAVGFALALITIGVIVIVLMRTDNDVL